MPLAGWLTLTPAMYQHHDATQEFTQRLNDPRQWVIKPGVPVFKPHQRVDPNTGKLIVVDVPKLYRIAAKMQQMERGGVPVRMTIGHTEPGKSETEQPPVSGVYRNARVQPFGPQQELAVVCDEWLDPAYAPHRKNYLYRSAEYYDDQEQITGVALLTRDPYLDLGVVAYTRGHDGAVHYSNRGERPLGYHLLLGAEEMFPQYYPSGQVPFAAAPGAQPQYPQVAPPQPQPVHYAAQPVNPFAPAQAQPVAYGYPQVAGGQYPAVPPGFTPETPPANYGTWGAGGNRGGHQRPNIGHQHNQGSFGQPQRSNYAYGQEGGGMPQAGGMGMGGGGGGGEVCPHCGQPLGYEDDFGGSGGFPGQLNQPPTMNRMGYSRLDPATAPGATTISGLPVGYAAHLSQVNYQLQQLTQANQVLMYERDQADTAACAEAINGLAMQGFPVGEYEFSELKKKSGGERAAYIQHIATHYQQVPTSAVPPQLGDPTPFLAGGSQQRPMTKDEMQAALRAESQTGVPFEHYARGGGAPTHYGQPQANGYAPPAGVPQYMTSQPGYGYDPQAQVANRLPHPSNFGFSG